MTVPPQSLHPGDIVLCDVESKIKAQFTDAKEILPAEDRFSNMLVLGPTGCGKTSQMLLPMIDQDMKDATRGITVLEPTGELALKAAMLAVRYGRDAILFDPTLKGRTKFNPLAGSESDVVDNITAVFRVLNPSIPQFTQGLNDQLLCYSLKVLKRLDKAANTEGKYATLIWLSRLVQNTGGQGRELVNRLSEVSSPTESEARENGDIVSWFLNDYFPERSKAYENTADIRAQVSKLVSNEYLREILNPDWDRGEKSEIDFNRILAEGGVLCVSTAQGLLHDLSQYLGCFFLMSLQSAAFHRPGVEKDRLPHSLYIDEFPYYPAPDFDDMLTQSHSLRICTTLTAQSRAQIKASGGEQFAERVLANTRNIVLFHGLELEDAKYYSDQFEKFSPSNLIYSDDPGNGNGHIVYSILKNGSVQPPQKGISKRLLEELETKVSFMSERHRTKHSRSTVEPSNTASNAPALTADHNRKPSEFLFC